MVIVDTEGAHGGLLIVHAKTLFPKPKPVMFVVGESAFEIIPVPETKVHAPVPTAGAFPAIMVFGFEMHNV